MKKRHYFFICSILFTTSCNNKPTHGETQSSRAPVVETVAIDVDRRTGTIDFDDVFSDYRLIPLETTKESLIGRIERISIFEDHIYILDSQNEQVLAFDNTGKFLNTIGRVGGGEGEYNSVMDFTIDKHSRQLILHTDRPYALYRYDLEGDYVGKRRIKTFYKSIAWTNKRLVMSTWDVSLDHLVFVWNLETGEEEEFFPTPKEAQIFHSFGTHYPYLLESDGTFAYVLFSNQIYKYHEGKVVPRYKIDFGDKNLPEHYLDGTFSASEIDRAARENEYGLKVGHFRETDNFLCFGYGATIVVYSKKTHKSEIFGAARVKGGLFFQNYFGHDGDDETLMGIYSADLFAQQIEVCKKNPTLWGELPDHVKLVAANVDSNSNPVLMQCTLKSE